MKNLMIILSTFLVYVSCQQAVDIESEKAAIKAVIEKSSKAYIEKDYESMVSCWLNDETATRINASTWGYGFLEGWEGQAQRYKDFFEDNPEPMSNQEIFTNYRIKIYSDNAHVIVDRHHLTDDGDSTSNALHTYQLEKDNDKWKIACLTTVMAWSYDMGDQNMMVSDTYHQLNPEDIDEILTDDFVGWDEIGGKWTKQEHKAFWNVNKDLADSIIYQMANGNLVATSFKRSGKLNGEEVNGEAMQFKRFENGKIAELWEYGFGVLKQ